jgi:hypothetical protein
VLANRGDDGSQSSPARAPASQETSAKKDPAGKSVRSKRRVQRLDGYQMVGWKGWQIKNVRATVYLDRSARAADPKAAAYAEAKRRGRELVRKAAAKYIRQGNEWLKQEPNGPAENRAFVEVWRYDPASADLAGTSRLGGFSPGYECTVTVKGWFVRYEKLAKTKDD